MSKAGSQLFAACIERNRVLVKKKKKKQFDILCIQRDFDRVFYQEQKIRALK